MVNIEGKEGLSLHSGQKFGGVNRFTVVTDAARRFGESRGELGLTRRDQRPAVDEYLRADLLRDRLSVGRDRTGTRGRHAALQVQPRGMFGRIAIAAPPKDGAV